MKKCVKLLILMMAVFMLRMNVLATVPIVNADTNNTTDTASTTSTTDAANTASTTDTTNASTTSSNGQTVAKLSAPTGVKAVKNAKGNISVIWNAVTGAASYKVCRITNNDDTKVKSFDATKKTSITDKDIKAGNLYVYYVAAMDGDDTHTSDVSEVAYHFEEPAEFVVNTSFTKKKKEKLTWTKVAGASSYIVYKQNSNGEYENIACTDKTSYQDSKVKKGNTYKYKVGYQVVLPDGSVLLKKSKAISVYASLIDPNKKMVALTFDDGPGKYTQEIVTCLKKNDSRATFFVLGCNINSYKSAVKNADKIGCEIANHSYDHTILTRLSAAQVKTQMKDTDAKIKKITGSNSTLMRCPGGGVNKTVQGAVGKPIILWSIDTLDWKTRNTDKTISAVMNNVKDGDIVLMHDIHEPTKRAALYLIPELRKKGYQLVTVSELAKYRGYKLKKGTIYHSLRKKKK